MKIDTRYMLRAGRPLSQETALLEYGMMMIRQIHDCIVSSWVRLSTRSHAGAVCVLAAVLGASGCASTRSSLAGPEYRRPEVAQKANWSELEGRQLNASEVIRADWWTGFGDPYLDELIGRALGDGLDLKIAALRLEKAGIQVSKERRSATPKLSASPTDAIARQRSNSGAVATARDTEMLGVGLSWEIDIWGKIAKGLQAADAGYRGVEMDWRAAHLALVADVAQQYFQVHQYDEQISQQVASKKQAEDLLQIYQAQFGEGMIAETQLRSQKAEISSLANRLLDLNRGRSESELKLATLVGVPSGDLKVPVAYLRDSVHLLELPAALPADILSRRPDVLKAEYTVLQAHHLVGKARLARLPTFSLAAVAKTGGSLVSTLVNSWSFGLATSFGGMFDRDLKIEVELSKADVDIAVAEYRRTVLRAFEEVEIALLNLDTRQRQMSELAVQIENLQVVRNVQDGRLREGLISQLEVFDTERSLLAAQQETLTTYQQLLTDTVTLYKALGGGWPPENVGGPMVRPVVLPKK